MTVFKIVATGELACYSVLDPSLKMHGSDKTLKERLAELGAKRPFMLPACMHHGDFIKPFKENFPDAQLVLTSGFTCPQVGAAVCRRFQCCSPRLFSRLPLQHVPPNVEHIGMPRRACSSCEWRRAGHDGSRLLPGMRCKLTRRPSGSLRPG